MGTETGERYRDWVGRRQITVDEMSPATSRAAAALFDRDDLDVREGMPLPPLWYWFHFLPTAPQRRLSTDGHPERGEFMPPIPLPRRMFAGARARFVRPLRVGRRAEREAEILSVSFKTGRSGELAFVTVAHRIRQGGELCVDEEQDIVYREAGGTVPAPVPREPEEVGEGVWADEVQVDTRMLFRFSALTYNAHRIHYDHPYATGVEGYPGLVVHGPLTAMLLAELVRRNDERSLAGFDFRGRAPLFETAPIRLLGRPDDDGVGLEARRVDGKVALTAEARFAS